MTVCDTVCCGVEHVNKIITQKILHIGDWHQNGCISHTRCVDIGNNDDSPVKNVHWYDEQIHGCNIWCVRTFTLSVWSQLASSPASEHIPMCGNAYHKHMQAVVNDTICEQHTATVAPICKIRVGSRRVTHAIMRNGTES